LGYINLDEVVQVYSPSGGEVDLDSAAEIALNFRSHVFDGSAQTNTVLVRGEEEINMIIAGLGLLRAPCSLKEVQSRDPLNLQGRPGESTNA
jgi:hypothetical protein